LTTAITENRKMALQIGYHATDWTQPIAFDDYVKGLENWSVKTLERDSQPIGAVFQNGDELHVSVLPEWRCKWLTKGLYKELFMQKRVVTKVTAGHDHMYGILRRIGFRDDANGLLVKD
jgi:hypothetical protein